MQKFCLRPLLSAAISLVASGFYCQAEEDLLDPGEILKGGARVPETSPVRTSSESYFATGKAALRPDSRRDDPSAGRSMAARVVSALNGLSQAGAQRLLESQKLKSEAAAKGMALNRLLAEIESKLNEFRSGEFCSGCSKTKTEILATGSEFPHKDQTAIPMTEAQIEAKRMELQAPIDKLRAELVVIDARLKTIAAELAEILDQIHAGHSLWVTGVSYEHALIWEGKQYHEAVFRDEHQKAQAKISSLGSAWATERDAEKLTNLRKEIDRWTVMKGNLEERRKETLQRSRAATTRASSRALQECESMSEYFDRPGIRLVLNLAPSLKIIGSRGTLDGMGVYFRMGDYSPARHSEILPDVKAFIAQFTQGPVHGCRVAGKSVVHQEDEAAIPAPEESVIPAMKKELRDLIEAVDPPKNDLPRKSTQGGSGIRG